MKIDQKDLNVRLRKAGYTPTTIHDNLKLMVEKDLSGGNPTDLIRICEMSGLGPESAAALYQIAYDRADWEGEDEGKKKPEQHLITSPLEKLSFGEREIERNTKLWRINLDPKYVYGLLIVTDTHLGNRNDNVYGLEEMYKEAIEAGVTAALHIGDLTDGFHRRHRDSWKYLRPDCLGFEGQLDYVVENYPTGLPTYFIGGNHDHFLMQTGDVDICREIAKYRNKDMFYLKQESIVEATTRDLDPETLMEVLEAKKLGSGRIGAIKMGPPHLKPKDRHTIHMLMHPGDGSAQALSYKPQRIVAGIEGIAGTFDGMQNPRGKRIKPHMLHLGHYHKRIMSVIRGIRVYQCATGKLIDEFHEVKNLMNMTGYWMMNVHVNKDGNTIKVDQTFRDLKVKPTRATRTVVQMRE